jgi:hypothetical protein
VDTLLVAEAVEAKLVPLVVPEVSAVAALVEGVTQLQREKQELMLLVVAAALAEKVVVTMVVTVVVPVSL